MTTFINPEKCHPDIEPVDLLNRNINHLSIELQDIAEWMRVRNHPLFVRNTLGQSTILGEYEADKRIAYRFDDYDKSKGRYGMLGLWDELHQISRHTASNLIPRLIAYNHSIAGVPDQAELHEKLTQLVEVAGMMKEHFLQKNTELLDAFYAAPKDYGPNEEADKVAVDTPSPSPINMNNEMYMSEGRGKYARHIEKAKSAFIGKIGKAYAQQHPDKTLDPQVADVIFDLTALRIAGSQGTQSQTVFQHKKILRQHVGIGIETAIIMERMMQKLVDMGVDIKKAKLGIKSPDPETPSTFAPRDTLERQIHDHLHDLQMMIQMEKLLPPVIDRQNKTVGRKVDPTVEVGMHSLAGRIDASPKPDIMTVEDVAALSYVAADSLSFMLDNIRKPPAYSLASFTRYVATDNKDERRHYDDHVQALRKAGSMTVEGQRLSSTIPQWQEKLAAIKEHCASAAASTPEQWEDMDKQLVQDISTMLPLAQAMASEPKLECPGMAEALSDVLRFGETDLKNLPRDGRSAKSWESRAATQRDINTKSQDRRLWT